MTVAALRMLLADEDSDALERLAALLEPLGHRITSYAIEVAEVPAKVLADDPDVSVVVLHRDDDHAIALIGEILAYSNGPVIALVQHEDPDFVARAAEHGISAYGKPETPEAVQSAIELAIRRHAEVHELSEKVDQLEGALERRALIERAKGILMERHGVDERTAFERLRTHARGARRRVVDVARDVSVGELELP